MLPKTNILIIEPSDIIRTGIKALVDDERFSFLAPMREYPADLPTRLARIQPDILIINPTLLPSPARTTLASLTQARPSMSIVGLIYQYIEPSLREAFRTQIDIREQGGQLMKTLLQCCKNESDTSEDSYELSDRETEVLLLVAQGFSSKEIAEKLHISVHTVNTHRKNITHKTGIKSVAGLAVYAMLHNLIN